MNLCSVRRRQWAGLMALLAAGWCFATHAHAAAPRLRVTTTVSMLTDLVRDVGGERVAVEGLMGPGVDPHLYKATASDITRLGRAQVVFYVGLHLEGKMQEVFDKLERSGKPAIAVAASLPRAQLLQPPQFEGNFDPHVWFDATLWAKCADAVVAGLAKADPAGREHYETRGKDLQKRYAALHAWALERAAELPKYQRVLITSHDAFSYFGRAYGFEVIGLQGISTVTEAGLADMAKLVDFVKRRGVKAVFVESSVSHATLERISKDAGVKIGGELFSDAMGTPGQIENGYDVGTYEGMIRHNLNTIVGALK
jgi:manganese/zinc/iron transport system substrate-binding protein